MPFKSVAVPVAKLTVTGPAWLLKSSVFVPPAPSRLIEAGALISKMSSPELVMIVSMASPLWLTELPSPLTAKDAELKVVVRAKSTPAKVIVSSPAESTTVSPLPQPGLKTNRSFPSSPESVSAPPPPLRVLASASPVRSSSMGEPLIFSMPATIPLKPSAVCVERLTVTPCG